MEKSEIRKLRKGQWATLEEVKQHIEATGFDKNLAKSIVGRYIIYKTEDLIRQLPSEDLFELNNWLTDSLNKQNNK